MLQTRSQFFYGHEVTDANKWIDFQEGVNVRAAELRLGYYSLTEFLTECERAMEEVGSFDYSVTVNRSTRIVTITAGSTFSLLTSSGTHFGTDAFSLLGFSGADKTGASTYAGGSASGLQYRPQFFLQDYVDAEHNQEAVAAVINETGSGVIEVVKFGTRKFMECNIQFINDYHGSPDSLIEYDPNGVSNAVLFLQDLVKKGHIEFMPDRDDPETFQTFVLESTEKSQQGTGYRLFEDIESYVAGYYRTGRLVFRQVE
jgi:hypothetical protein